MNDIAAMSVDWNRAFHVSDVSVCPVAVSWEIAGIGWDSFEGSICAWYVFTKMLLLYMIIIEL